MIRAIFNKKYLPLFLEFMDSKYSSGEFDPIKRQLNFNDPESNPLLKLRIPIDTAYNQEKNLLYSLDFKNYVLVLIRSGIASVGFFENYINMDHKVFRAYMVRKKQGKSQIKFLKTKGKSRAGSRVRLAETLEFFEEINHRLHSYFDQFRIDEIGLNFSETLMPYFYDGKTAPPFQKDDPRIFKIPKHIQNPTFETLLATNEFLLKPEIKYNEQGKVIWDEFLNTFETESFPDDPDDNW